VEIQIPAINPRPYQLPFFRAMDSGMKRGVLVWHRRAGKDDVCMHMTAGKALDRVGNYWHCLPEYAQARKAIWEAVNPHTGRRRIDEAFPKAIRAKTREDEMFIEFANGSTWRLVGSDRVNSLVGAGPAGIVYSEFALSDPAAWDYMRPMLLESGGWAVFNSTVRGRNHFWRLAEYAKNNPDWFYSNLAADDTGVFTEKQLQSELADLIALHGEDIGRSRYLQEYMNDPDVAIPGAVYASLLTKMERDGRITDVPYDPAFPVITAWDLGYGDATSIWFVQQVGLQVRVIDYMEGTGVDISVWAKRLKELPYAYHEAILPHDAASGHINGESVAKQLKSLGFRIGCAGANEHGVLPRTSEYPQIQKAKAFLQTCVIDRSKCARGIEALRNVHYEWDDSRKVFKDNTKHDWSSHAGAAWRYLAVGFRPVTAAAPRAPGIASGDYEMFGG